MNTTNGDGLSLTNRATRSPQARHGLSLLDVVVIIALAGVLLALFMLRVGGSRESSRRMGCEDNLRAIHLATESYVLRYGVLPIGTQNTTSPIRSEPKGRHHNWAEGLLPFLGQETKANEINFDESVYSKTNQAIGQTAVPSFRCGASSRELSDYASSYAGVTSSTERPIDTDGDGLLVLNRAFSYDEITDGRAYTFLLGEKAIEFSAPDGSTPDEWNSGTRTTLRTTGHLINASVGSDAVTPLFVGGFSSNHVGGAYFLFADGSFRFFAEEADLRMMQGHASRSGEPVEIHSAP